MMRIQATARGVDSLWSLASCGIQSRCQPTSQLLLFCYYLMPKESLPLKMSQSYVDGFPNPLKQISHLQKKAKLYKRKSENFFKNAIFHEYGTVKYRVRLIKNPKSFFHLCQPLVLKNIFLILP